jgi:glyoxylase-like metal-dependent hydrolase (beta-lactamase superfamily II)
MVSASRIALVRAPNPSAMTLTGTNSYLIDDGAGNAVVIDPGPPIAAHVDALVEAAHERNVTIRAIALTHGHPDHAPAAPMLANKTGAPIYAHPKSEVSRDRDLPVEGRFVVAGIALRVIDAPGHTFDHVVFYEPRESALFTGDVILGEGTVVIAPPGGAMRPYQRTLARLAAEFPNATTIYGGHGPVVADAQAKIREYIEHRRTRERELLEALAHEPQTIPDLVMRIYGPGRRILWPAMARQMLAYLIELEREGRVRAEPLERDLDERENEMLNPSWEGVVGREHAELIRAELGSEMRLERLSRYTLITTLPN